MPTLTTSPVTQPAPEFRLMDDQRRPHTLASIADGGGVMLGFCEDVWQLATVRRVMWLQKQAYNLTVARLHAVVIVPNVIVEVYMFRASVVYDLTMPVLADPDNTVRMAYGVHTPTLFLIDEARQIRKKWSWREDINLDTGQLVRR